MQDGHFAREKGREKKKGLRNVHTSGSSKIIYIANCDMNYFLIYNKNIRFDFDDDLKIGDVRYDNMTKITIKVQLF